MEEEEQITVLIIGKSFYDRTCALFKQKAFYISRIFFPFGQNFYLNLSEARVTFSIFNGKIVTPITLSIVTKKVPN